VCYNETVGKNGGSEVTTDLMTATPPEVDEKLAELWALANTARATLEDLRVSLHQLMDIRAEYVGRRRVYKHSLREIVEMARDFEPDYYGRERKVRYLDGVEAATRSLEEARTEAGPLEDRFERERWSRFFLVNNKGGHIHSSMQCSTCFIDTSFSWLPALSGLTEKDAVEEYGAILCTVCFPSAPVEWTGGISKVEQAEKDARKAEREARAAAKAAKAIAMPDGSPLLGAMSWEIGTLVTAQRELTDALVQVRVYRDLYPDHHNAQDNLTRYQEAADRIVTAIAHKLSTTEAEVLAEAEAKAAKKFKKEYA
jgi:hypothetical protein